MLFIDYKKNVLHELECAKIRAELSDNLLRPTPSKIRSECLIVLRERFNKETDTKSLRLFFGHLKTQNEAEKAILNLDINRFKPLTNFLKGKTRETADKNIELLAWLINVKPRPYSFATTTTESVIDKKIDVIEVIHEGDRVLTYEYLPTKDKKTNKNLSFLERINICILIVLFLFVIFYVYTHIEKK